MKTCTKCKVEKQSGDFYSHKQTADRLYPHCKACSSLISKLRYEKNKEAICEKSRIWRILNKEKASESYSEYREKNKQKLSQYYKEWLSANRDKARAHNSKWAKANKDRYSAYSRNRRAAKALSGGSHTTEDIRAIFEKQGGLCASCKIKLFKSGKQKYHVDHIMPLARGGSNWPSNLQCLCPACNLSKGAKHPDDWAKQQGRLL